MKGWVCITGASSGFGKQFAYEYAKKGYGLVLVARRENLLEEIANQLKSTNNPVITIGLDLLKDDSAKLLAHRLKEHNIMLDYFFNNAGFGDYGPFQQASLTKLNEMILLNVNRLTQLTHTLLPTMKTPSTIIQVSSLASFMPGPNMAVYYATKAYVTSFSQALNHELKSQKIKVLTLCPGPVATEFGQVANAKSVAAFQFLKSQPVEQAVKNAIKDIEKGNPIIFTNPIHPVIVFLLRFLPKKMIVKLVAKIQQKRHEG